MVSVGIGEKLEVRNVEVEEQWTNLDSLGGAEDEGDAW